MPLCFAYGSNMDASAMAERCPASRPLGVARLPRHRFVIMREGYASVLRDPRRSVWGLLWELALSDVPALDRYEDVAGGLYRKVELPVLVAGGSRRALTYLGRVGASGRPLPGYLEGVLAAAEALALPPAYRAELAGWAGAGESAATRWTHGAPPRPTRSSPREPTRPTTPPSWRWTP